MARTHRNALLIVAAVVAVGLACDSGESSEDYYSASITLTNNGTQDVHLLGPGESMSEANRVSPGGSRTVIVSFSSHGGSSFTFRVERPEGQLGQVMCTAGTILSGASVLWNGSAATCQGW